MWVLKTWKIDYLLTNVGTYMIGVINRCNLSVNWIIKISVGKLILLRTFSQKVYKKLSQLKINILYV